MQFFKLSNGPIDTAIESPYIFAFRTSQSSICKIGFVLDYMHTCLVEATCLKCHFAELFSILNMP